MNLQKLENASKVLEQIKAIDAEIISLEKIAIQLSNGQSCKLSIEVEIPIEEKKPNVFDEHGFIKDEFKCGGYANAVEVSTDFHSYMLNRMRESIEGSIYGKSKEKSPSIKYESALIDTDALAIVNVLMFRKNQQRQVLINKIEKLSL